MVSNANINFKSLSKVGYENSDILRVEEIADEVDSNSKDLNLLVNGYGDGKSTATVGMLQPGDIFAMGNYAQVLEKMKGCESKQTVMGMTNKYQLIVGQLKWLGFKWENDELVKDPDRVYQNRDPWVWNRNKGKVEKFDLEAERRKPYVHAIIDDIEEHGRKNALDYHKDQPIVEAYGQHLHPETRKQTICFTPIDMLDLVNEMHQTGDLIVDEGMGGEPKDLGKLKNYADTIQRITGRQVNSRTSKPKCKIPSIDNSDIENDMEDLWKKTRSVYIDLYDAINQKEAERDKENLVYCDIDELIDKNDILEIARLAEDVRDDNSKGVPKVKEEKISCKDFDKISRINELLWLADWLVNTYYEPAKVEAYRDKHNSVNKIYSKYPKYYDIIDYADKAQDVYILNASADRDLPQWYVEESQHFSPETEIHGAEAGIEHIDEDELVTEHIQFDYGRNSTISKDNLASGKFQNVIAKFMDWMDGDNFVTTVKNDRNGNKLPEVFETESTNHAKIEGSNKARECDNLFVVGSNRLPDKKMWHTIKNRYQEIVEFNDKEWYALKKIEKNIVEGEQQYGSQIGWKDPEEEFDWFEWEGDYDFNPLQKIWQQRVDRHKFEKQFRKRFQQKDRGEGFVITWGVRPVIGGEPFGKNMGNESDFISWIIEQKKGTALQKAKWIKENIDSHYGFIEWNLPDGIPLKSVYEDNGRVNWKIDYRGVIEEELQQKSWNKDPMTGEESRQEVELYEAVEDILGKDIEELPFSKKSLRRWVKDSTYLEYSRAMNQNDSTTVKASDVSRSPWDNIPDSPI